MDISGGSLANAVLFGAGNARSHVDTAYMVGTNISDSHLNGATFGRLEADGLIGTNSKWGGVSMEHASFRAANFDGAALGEAELPYADLRDASFVGTYFVDALVIGADVAGATFDGANLSGAMGPMVNADQATWISTLCPDDVNSDDAGGTCVGHLTPIGRP